VTARPILAHGIPVSAVLLALCGLAVGAEPGTPPDPNAQKALEQHVPSWPMAFP